MLKVTSLTDKGLKRKHNEDSYLIDQAKGVIVLADGLGGYEHGETASSIATQSSFNYLISHLTPSILSRENLLDAVKIANQDVLKFKKENQSTRKMATTLTCVVIHENKLEFAYIGDSRVYHLSAGDKTLHLLSTDHTLAQEMREKGLYQNITDASRNLLTRHVGSQAALQIDYTCTDLQTEDIVLVCSDGLSSVLNDEEIEKCLINAKGDLELASASMLEQVNKLGAPDNITLVLAKV